MILDEADEMLSMGFKEDLEEILSSTPEEKQILLFSADKCQKSTWYYTKVYEKLLENFSL